MTYVSTVSVQATCGIFIGLGFVATSTRIWVAAKVKKGPLGYDDWLSIPAFLLTFVAALTLLIGAAHGYVGSHSSPPPTGISPEAAMAEVSPEYAAFAKYEYVFQLTQPLALGAVKLSILALFDRIFRGKPFLFLNWSLIVITVAWMFAFCFGSAFSCGSKPHYYWGSLVETGIYCVDIFNVYVASAISDVIVDIGILILPLPFIWQLHMPFKTKVLTSLIFLIGFFSVVAGILKMGFILKINYFSNPTQQQPVLGLKAYDQIGIVSILLFWQMVQIGVAQICSNLLTMKPLITKLGQDIRSGRYDSYLEMFSLLKSSKARASSNGKSDMKPSSASGDSNKPSGVIMETKTIMTEAAFVDVEAAPKATAAVPEEW